MHPVLPSAARINANRVNALRSKGPRTPAGKARSSRNALRSGRYALPPANPDPYCVPELGEDPAALERLRQSLEASFQPANGAEALLVNDLTLLRWQRQRLERSQAARPACRLRQVELRSLRHSLNGNVRVRSNLCTADLKRGLLWTDDLPAKFSLLQQFYGMLSTLIQSGQIRTALDLCPFIYGPVSSVRGQEIRSHLRRIFLLARRHAPDSPAAQGDDPALEDDQAETAEEPEAASDWEAWYKEKIEQLEYLVRVEIAHAAQDQRLFERQYVEVTEAMRTECLAPAAEDRWLISQMGQVDRQIERKTLLLLALQHERRLASQQDQPPAGGGAPPANGGGRRRRGRPRKASPAHQPRLHNPPAAVILSRASGGEGSRPDSGRCAPESAILNPPLGASGVAEGISPAADARAVAAVRPGAQGLKSLCDNCDFDTQV